MNPEELLAIARKVVEQAEPNEQIEVACSHTRSTSVKVYDQEIESFTQAENLGLGVRVLVEGREGFASIGTLDPDVVDRALAEARDNAAFAEADEFAGVARPDGVEANEISLWRPGVDTMATEEKIGLALELEKRVRAADSRITGIRTSVYGDSVGAFALASTAGIEATNIGTSASAMVQPLAQDGDRAQIGFGWDGARDPADLDRDGIVERAVSRTVDLLGASKPASSTVDLVLEPRLAATVIGMVAGMLSGQRVIKGRTPFAGRVGETVASPLLTFLDDPTDPDSLGADSHDGEGLACRPVPLVEAGVLQGYFHDSYTGRRSGDGSTGSAVRGARSLPGPGIHALTVRPGSGGLEEFIAGIEHGVMVFSLDGLHAGVNPVSGDFSVGASGRMIRNGELAEPINECTLASTLQRLVLDIGRVGADVIHLPSGVTTPSLVVNSVALSGA